MLLTLVVIWLLNLADFGLTVNSLALGLAREANPVASAMIAQGLPAAFALKVGLITLCCLGLWLLRSYRLARGAAVAVAGLYGAVVLYQVTARLFF